MADIVYGISTLVSASGLPALATVVGITSARPTPSSSCRSFMMLSTPSTLGAWPSRQPFANMMSPERDHTHTCLTLPSIWVSSRVIR